MKRRMTKDGTVRKAANAQASTRRDFLKYSALVAGYGVYVATEPRGEVALAQQSPNERVNVAWVGIGGKGDGDTSQLTNRANIVAICDVDSFLLDKKEKEFATKGINKDAKRFNDWRKMFDEMGDKIDAVGVSIPDHNHAIVAHRAISMGKAVYCQKPLTHSIAEARLLRESSEEKKVATQMGNQGTANATFRTGVEVMRSGALGAIKEFHVWTNRPIWPQAPGVMSLPPATNVPANLNWDVWLGPAPKRDYSDVTQDNKNAPYHQFNWRGWWDFGTGALGDMGCHTVNMPFMGLKLKHPTKIMGVCGDLNPLTYPSWATVHLEFPAREDLPPVKMTWYEGHFDRDKKLKNLPPMALFQGQTPANSGSLIIGENGTMYSPADYGERWMLLPLDKFADFKKPDPTLPRFQTTRDDDNQKVEWLAAIKGGPAAHSNFSYAGLLAETVLLGDVAIRVPGQPLEWDGPAMKFTNNPAANKFLQTEYRTGWTL